MAAQQKCHVRYTPPLPLSRAMDDDAITLMESRAVVSAAGGTGYRTWEAALRLGTFLTTTAEGNSLVKGKSILELGAGTGFLSILCAKNLGASYVLATDGDMYAVETVDTNIMLNGLDHDSKIKTKVYRWGHHLEGLFPQEHEPLQTVIAADVTYDEALIAPLLSTFKSFLDRYPTLKIVLAATIRNEETWMAFVSAFRMASLEMVDIPFEPPPTEHQTGFFHSTGVPIRIIQLKRAHQEAN
ncbi:MAG: hypothetical protein M1823_003088 [Watsoniomyces obsoletus]|nr:MAG: hypothetical protein M1823_003088 [Watsoniomyces obsoletus]